MEKIKVLTTVEFEPQDIIDVLITALEGGSNYWYQFGDSNEGISKFTDKSLSECVGLSVLEKGAIVPIYDYEDENELLGTISKENIERGLKLFIEDGRCFEPEMDAEDADIFFQFVVMGKIVFG